MRILFFTFLITMVGISNANAQAVMESIYEIRHAFDFYRNQSQSTTINPLHVTTEVLGSPYLNDEFIDGVIYTKSKMQFVDVPLRFNVYQNQVEFRNEKKETYAIATPEIIERIEFGDYLIEYIPYQQGNKTQEGYFLVLEKGEATLYSRLRVSLEQPKPPGGYQEAVPARFIDRPEVYFVRIGEEPAVEISKRKDIESVFSSKKNIMNSLINTKRIKPNDEQALLELVKHYNSN